MDQLLLPVVLFFSTYILEDPTAYWALVLVEENRIEYWPALVAVSLGIFSGDLWLYTMGRWGTGLKILDRQVDRIIKKVEHSSWYLGISRSIQNNHVAFIVFSRFMPGFRLPVYFLSGRYKTSFMVFSLVTFVMSFVWVKAVFSGVSFGFDYFTKLTGIAPLPLYLLLFFIFLVFLRIMNFIWTPYKIKALYFKILSWRQWEFWPPWVFYFPLFFKILQLTFKYRLFITSLTAANPCFKNGGLSFDAKAEMLEVFSGFAEYVARTELVKDGVFPQNIEFPIIAKPDKGHRGDSVKLIHDRSELEEYSSSVKRPFLLQQYIPYPLEYGIFWVRLPWESEGKIWSVTRKILPEMEGNGRDNLVEQIFQDQRARYMANAYIANNVSRLDTVLAQGEKIRLANAGNHCMGAVFEDGEGDITGRTQAAISAMCNQTPGFYFGRFDIKFRDIASLENGEGFRILEVNGAEAEATHIYDKKYPVSYAYKVLFAQWEILYQIASWNRKHGIRPIPALQGLYYYARFFLFKR